MGISPHAPRAVFSSGLIDTHIGDAALARLDGHAAAPRVPPHGWRRPRRARQHAVQQRHLLRSRVWQQGRKEEKKDETIELRAEIRVCLQPNATVCKRQSCRLSFSSIWSCLCCAPFLLPQQLSLFLSFSFSILSKPSRSLMCGSWSSSSSNTSSAPNDPRRAMVSGAPPPAAAGSPPLLSRPTHPPINGAPRRGPPAAAAAAPGACGSACVQPGTGGALPAVPGALRPCG